MACTCARRTTVSRVTPLLLQLLLLPISTVGAQEPPEETAPSALRLFIDCRGFQFCDRDFYLREIPYVNHTRDREDSQVHVLVTSDRTGGGGQRFTLDFIGREEFEGIDDRLELTTRANLAVEQVMTRLARRIQLGVARYIARTSQSDDIRMVSEAAADEAPVATPEDDPWNFWTFSLNASGFYSGQDRQYFLFASGGVNANRITDASKVQLSVSSNYNESSFDISETESVKSIRRGYSASALTVWSLGAHWGWGGQVSGASRRSRTRISRYASRRRSSTTSFRTRNPRVVSSGFSTPWESLTSTTRRRRSSSRPRRWSRTIESALPWK